MTDTEATVLVVDDDPMLREAFAEQLALLGHRVAMAPSAEAALEALDGGLAADLVRVASLLRARPLLVAV